jgi:hypothetical protein
MGGSRGGPKGEGREEECREMGTEKKSKVAATL